jgi:hypothetical protein
MDIPVHVYLLGFEPAVAEALASRLKPTPIDHASSSSTRTFPPDPSDPQAPLAGTTTRAPTQPIARFLVHDLDAAFDAAFLDAAQGWAVPERTSIYDANAAEEYLAQHLPEANAVLDRANPVFIIFHGGETLGEHGWRHTYVNGYLEPVRIFGERAPLTFFDVSAIEDPFVTGPPRTAEGIAFSTAFGASPKPAYDWPIAAQGDETLDILAQLTVDAANYRFLKGPLYPISTRPCHHVTLLLAVHQSALTETLPGFTRAQDWIDIDGLERAFENLTGDEVSVELKTLTLPQDDPALDAAYRAAGTLVLLDPLRWYVDENFDRYVTPQEGCEEYLSMLLYGDATTQSLFGGIGVYDVQRGHRLSFSVVNDITRVRNEYTGPGEEVLSTRNESMTWDRLNLLFSHETGHIFGQQHPQHASATDGSLPPNHAFQSVYSVMAYEPDDRLIDYGSVDFATWTRGRVGYTIRDAQALGLEGTPAFEGALSELRTGHWLDAHLALEAAVQTAAQAEPDALPAFHLTDQHLHP